MTYECVFHLPDLDATQRLSSGLASDMRRGDCLLLTGTLGAGKTCFARAYIQACCGEVEVVSPTFTLVQDYKADNGLPIYHADLYRLTSPDDLRELGMEEWFEHGVCLIEWPELADGQWPENALRIVLELDGASARQVTMRGSHLWKTRLERLAADYKP